MTPRPLHAPRPRPPLARAAAWLGHALIGLLAAGLLLALVAGVPYGLWHWLGWPLPHHWPTGTQIKDTVTGPFTDRILLDTLACLCWLVWAVFVADVARALPQTLQDARLDQSKGRSPTPSAHCGRRSGPLRGLATLLLATIIASLVSLRPHPDLATRSTGPLGPGHPSIVATAVILDRTAVAPVAETSARARPAAPGTAIVQPPHDGIHDSLWRIADRYLGNGNRWPEIYQLNQDLPQPDGDRLTNPSLIRPGWILQLPSSDAGTTPGRPQTPASPGKTPAPTTPSRHTPAPNGPIPNDPTRAVPPPTGSRSTPTTPPDGPTGRSVPNPPTHATGSRDHTNPGVDLGDGLYVSLGLAAAISGALVTVRRRNRRWYTPGSGRRDDLPVAPVVRSLHLAHLRATTPPPEGDDGSDSDQTSDDAARDEDTDDEPDGHAVVHQSDRATAPGWHGHDLTRAGEPVGDAGRDHPGAGHRHRPWRATAAGPTARDHPTGVLDLSAARGVGLAGPGADAAARAMLLDLLTTKPNPVDITSGTAGNAGSTRGLDEVVIAADDLDHLTGARPTGVGLPARLHVVADVPAALDRLESMLVARAREAVEENGDRRPPGAAVVLFARVPSDLARLQAVLDNGAAADIAGVLLGQWRSGTSVYVQADGVVSAAHGPAAPPLGTRLFVLPEAATQTLLGLLHDAGQPGDPTRKTQPIDAEPPDVRESGGHGANGGAGRADGVRSATVSTPPTPITTDDAAPTPSHHAHEPEVSLQLRVLGPLSLTWSGHVAPTDRVIDPEAVDDGALSGSPAAAKPVETIGALSPRVRELLVALAVHPDGITRDRLADTLWPNSPPGRPFNSLNTALGRLRAALSRATDGRLAEIVLSVGDQHRLDPALVAVDYAGFVAAAQERQAASTDSERAQAWQRMLAAYRGELAEGVGAEWLETPREAIRRDAVDAATGLARLVVREDPRQALDLLEAARSRDPYNEALYGDIMRVQRRLGQADAIGRTLRLLATRLAELGESPGAETVRLAEALQREASRPPGSARSVEPAIDTVADPSAASST